MRNLNTRLCATVLSLSFLTGGFTTTYAGNQIATVINDGKIVAAIKLKEANDPLLNPFKIHVSSKRGVVTLQGKVKTQEQYERAVMQANSLDDVKDVDASRLHVETSKKPLNDFAITAKVKGKLIQAKIFEDSDIDAWGVKVETKNRQVFLIGKVDSDVLRNKIIKLAKSIKHVKSINSDGLIVES